MSAEIWQNRSGYRMRLVLDSLEVHRGESVTGRVECESISREAVDLRNLRVWIRPSIGTGANPAESAHTVVSRDTLLTGDAKAYPFTIQIPTCSQVGTRQLHLHTVGLFSSLAAPITLPFSVLPERRIVEVGEMICAVSRHQLGAWTSVSPSNVLTAHLRPSDEVRERVCGITVRMYTLRDTVYATLEVSTPSGNDPREGAHLFSLEAAPGSLASMQTELARVLRPFVDDLGQLPIPRQAQEAPEGLPIPAASRPVSHLSRGVGLPDAERPSEHNEGSPES